MIQQQRLQLGCQEAFTTSYRWKLSTERPLKLLIGFVIHFTTPPKTQKLMIAKEKNDAELPS
jgi:predicted secreted protein